MDEFEAGVSVAVGGAHPDGVGVAGGGASDAVVGAGGGGITAHVVVGVDFNAHKVGVGFGAGVGGFYEAADRVVGAGNQLGVVVVAVRADGVGGEVAEVFVGAAVAGIDGAGGGVGFGAIAESSAACGEARERCTISGLGNEAAERVGRTHPQLIGVFGVAHRAFGVALVGGVNAFADVAGGCADEVGGVAGRTSDGCAVKGLFNKAPSGVGGAVGEGVAIA